MEKLKNGYQIVKDGKAPELAVGSVQRGQSGEAMAFTTPTLRAPFDHNEFDRQRPLDRIPSKFNDIIKYCRMSYYRFGIIRNVIDLMTDFAAEDLEIAHADRKTQALIRVWLNKVKMDETVNEFIRHFLIDCQSVVKRTTAKLNKPIENQWNEDFIAQAKPDIKVKVEEVPTVEREIPWKYTFLNILALTWIDDKNDILNPRKLGFRVSKSLMAKIAKDSTQSPIQSINNAYLPPELIDQINKAKSGVVPLEMEKIFVAYNKKDSWDEWAMPFLYSVIGDLQYKTKLRQAESAALDGLINVIRIWKLGDHTNKIYPSATAIQRLMDIVTNNVNGGAIDIVWDSTLDYSEHYPPVDKFLGPDKYTQVNKDILIGLGVPDVLLGGDGSNFSNSYIQLKTIVERIKYVRKAAKSFVDNELRLFCRGMGIKILPEVRFKSPNLDDENINKKLVLELLDRGILSVEAVLNAYGEDFGVEIDRMKREKSEFKQAGIEVKSPLDVKNTDNTGKTTGRPPVAVDTSKRGTRTPKIRRASVIDLTLKAMKNVNLIDEVISKEYMSHAGLSTARQLTQTNRDEINSLRIKVLSCINPLEEVDKSLVIAKMQEIENKDIIALCLRNIKDFASKTGQSPTFEQLKYIEALSWVEFNGEENGEI